MPFDKLIEAVAWGARDTSSVAGGRLALFGAPFPGVIAGGFSFGLRSIFEYNTEEPTDQQINSIAQRLVDEATAPFDDPDLRNTLVELQRSNEQIIDIVSVDVVREAGFSQSDTERARSTVESFRRFIEEHRDDITALQLLYSKPYRARSVTYSDIKALADTISRPPLGWTADALWDAYARLGRTG